MVLSDIALCNEKRSKVEHDPRPEAEPGVDVDEKKGSYRRLEELLLNTPLDILRSRSPNELKGQCESGTVNHATNLCRWGQGAPFYSYKRSQLGWVHLCRWGQGAPFYWREVGRLPVQLSAFLVKESYEFEKLIAVLC
jgi:hypothetical protein